MVAQSVYFACGLRATEKNNDEFLLRYYTVWLWKEPTFRRKYRLHLQDDMTLNLLNSQREHAPRRTVKRACCDGTFTTVFVCYRGIITDGPFLLEPHGIISQNTFVIRQISFLQDETINSGSNYLEEAATITVSYKNWQVRSFTLSVKNRLHSDTSFENCYTN
jgi:hypothetical protein